MKIIRTPISRQEIRGRSKQFRGKVREHVGRLRHNRSAQLRGKLEQAEGRTRVTIGRAVRKAKARL